MVDCGFGPEVAAARGRALLRDPAEALRLLGVEPRDIGTLVLTHLNYGHVGNLGRFPWAEIHLQEGELHFAVGRHIRHAHLRHPFEVGDVVEVVRANYVGRVHLHRRRVNLRPGIALHPAPGHSAGLQFVTVRTARGTVVLASDVAHFYENLESDRPFTTCLDVGQAMESMALVRAIAPSLQHVVPGHDPLVMQRYPAVAGLEGIVVRLDVAPSE